MKEIKGKEIRESIINILRGRYATSVLATIGYLGIMDRLLERPHTIADFENIPNRTVLKDTLDYLVAINLLVCTNGTYMPSDLGRHVLTRAGSAGIVESYYQYLTHLPQILLDKGDAASRPYKVDRPLNIYGSGDIHRRKFFPEAIKMMMPLAPTGLIDIGCGDGTYLQIAATQVPSVRMLAGVDMSPESTHRTEERLTASCPEKLSTCVVCDAYDVARWNAALPPATGHDVISAWFVLHEFSRGSVDRVVEFFKKLYEHRPSAHVIVGELVRATPQDLAENAAKTIMPEFLYFHALSGQAPLSWDEWHHIVDAIPYKLSGECLFDTIDTAKGPVPSNFIWMLSPRS